MKTKYLLQITSAAALTAAMGFAGAAQAASLTQTISIDEQDTDFSELFEVDKFDSSQGTLTEVIIGLEGTIGGNVEIENISNSSPANFDLTLSGIFDLNFGGLDATDLISEVEQDVSLPVFDGDVDFAGDSGITFMDLIGTDSTSTSIMSGELFDLFVGGAGDTVSGEFLAEGDASFEGSSNIAFIPRTNASGLVSVEYVFEPTATPVPEPGTAIGVGLAAAAGWVMKKKKGQNA